MTPKSPLHDKRSRSVVNNAVNVGDKYALSRGPTKQELSACHDILKKQAALIAKSATPEAARKRAWESLARVLFSHHEFVMIR